MLRRWLVAATVTVVAVLALVPAGAGARSPAVPHDDLYIVDVDAGGAGELSLVVSVPSLLEGTVLTSDHLRLAIDGETVPVRVVPLPARDIEVVLVLDDSADSPAAWLLAQRGAAVELIRQLDPASPITLATRSRGVLTLAAVDRAPALAALATLTATSTPPIALDLERLPRATSRRTVVVLLSDASPAPVVSGGDTGFGDRLVTVHIADRATLRRPRSGDGTFIAPDPVAAFDAVVAQLSRQYRLVTLGPVATPAGSAQVQLGANGLERRVSVDLPPVLAVAPAAALPPATAALTTAPDDTARPTPAPATSAAPVITERPTPATTAAPVTTARPEPVATAAPLTTPAPATTPERVAPATTAKAAPLAAESSGEGEDQALALPPPSGRDSSDRFVGFLLLLAAATLAGVLVLAARHQFGIPGEKTGPDGSGGDPGDYLDSSFMPSRGKRQLRLRPSRRRSSSGLPQ